MILFETQRLLIRKIKSNDIKYLLEIYNSEKNMKFKIGRASCRERV